MAQTESPEARDLGAGKLSGFERAEIIPNRSLSQDRPRVAGKCPVVVARVRDDDGERIIKPPGRFGWALVQLVNAGERGISALSNPAPRLSHYIFRLRRDWGLAIETVHESHGGSYPGTHGRYHLRSKVEILADDANTPRPASP